ncbi:unnamed protein product, partial [Porites lobata]
EPHTYLDGKLLFTSKKWGREINDITTWVEAFTIFSWIFCTAHSFRWQIVTQYKLLIIKTSPGKPGLVDYVISGLSFGFHLGFNPEPASSK